MDFKSEEPTRGGFPLEAIPEKALC